jgi:glycosyltransferase involved in cell wall biosynthesis
MYNEAAGAATCVRTVCAQLARLGYRSKLIVVEDGSRDGTDEILRELESEEAGLLVVRHPGNRGYGRALQTGAGKALEEGFDYALFMDSDLTNNPEDISRFAAEMGRGFDVIKATRYSKGGRVIGVPAYRVWISKLGNALARALFRLPVADCTNGFRAVRTGLLAQMRLQENRFPIIMEELYWSKFLTRSFVEIPVTLTNRSQDQRPTSFTYRPAMFWSYLKYPLKAFFGLKPEIQQPDRRERNE